MVLESDGCGMIKYEGTFLRDFAGFKVIVLESDGDSVREYRLWC